MSDSIPAAAAARCIEALPDDVVAEILARVPDAVSLFRCIVVCRRWRRLVADPDFLLRRRAWPDGGGSSLVGFFVLPQKLVYDDEGYSSLAPTGEGLAFVPAPDLAGLGPGRRRRLTSFVRDDAGVLDHARPLAARDGLLLLRLPPGPGEKNSVLRMCVCNLISGRWDLLPPLEGAGLIEHGVGGYAVLTAADHGMDGLHRPADGYSSFFQVLLTGVRSNDLQVYLARFSSDSAATQAWYWKRVPELSAGPYGNRVAAVTCGIAHWVFIGTGPDGNGMQVLHVSISTGHVCATEIPYHVLPDLIQPDWSKIWLCPSIDGLPLFFYLDDNQLRIWSRQDDEDGDYTDEVWDLTQAIPLSTELGLSGIKSLSTVCIGEKSSTMLALNPDSGHPYVLHLRSRSSTMVAGWKESFNYVPAVPYEMNWSKFFMSRLGVQQ
ncbi:hypothetical protein PR202_gb25444 [Eleusine coracana subsp. coracana]|uniref:F-box domain-containing protein n=1 Tax=Eleusine coracana subsp. coracana TaxID=191504 RepID=A0AAV5FQ59_ELECO|nr:hypothetical protein QOZ80_8BG0652190 [Eleusine coracana subsp. coracana]GJN36570.1 hypothetical protein PR202_gb25444 [Eleusine coracana subsp. coracana]